MSGMLVVVGREKLKSRFTFLLRQSPWMLDC
jgi:hypothetical protein